MPESETPQLDELEKGPWPSFVTEIKKSGKKNPACVDLLRQLELSYTDGITHWKHGGVVGVKGYGSGVIGRYSDSPEKFPNVAAFHTFRVNEPSAWFYNTKALRKICDIWEKYGSGLTNFHGATGDMILLGTTTDNIQPCFDELINAGFDLGGSAAVLRTLSCCVGPARCNNACIDTLDLCYDLTQEFQNYIHRPHWGYKFKIKISGCPNDATAAIGRSDLSVIGVWRDALRIDQDAVREYVNNGFDINKVVVSQCPTEALEWDEKEKKLILKDEECVRCMHCINRMPKALRVGKERGARLMVGGKAPLVRGPRLGWCVIPFMKMEAPYTEMKDFLETLWDWWDENGRTRERIGELIERLGVKVFLKAMGLEPTPEMVYQPRDNTFIF